MTKSYISKIENNIKEVRLSTLKKIVELGLDGSIDLLVKYNKSCHNLYFGQSKNNRFDLKFILKTPSL